MKIAVVTGTRAEYGIWTPVLQAIARSNRLRLQLVVTGTHLLRDFGYTLDDIQRDGFVPAAIVPMYRPGDMPADSLALGTAGMARAFQKLSPDIVLVLGDRLEILAAVQAAMCLRIPIGHVHGGETAPGQFDEQIRHAVTKMAHVHFASTPRAAARIRQMGENPAHIHVVGAPALDRAVAAAKKFDHRRHRASGRPLLVLHPTTPDRQLQFKQAGIIINAIRSAYPSDQIDVIGSNNDPGHAGIAEFYARKGGRALMVQSSVSQLDFWRMLWECPFLIGNSSSGIIEAATFHIPVINIGDRQAGRERSGNVIDVSCTIATIRAAIKKATSPAFLRKVDRIKNLYGIGKSSQKIVRILERLTAAALSPKIFVD